MKTPQWERAKEIFDAALDLKPEERPGYLFRTCGDDVELRREVEDLLAADAEAGSFMNPGWLAPFSPFRPEPEFELAPGDVVSGRFKIVRPLGDGGMGRVYEAHDSVLGVQVALKTLRPEISANPEVLFRFRQEVRIAHRITHPNVCRTYHLDHELRRTGADESSSVDLTFLTMEFLEGETLQQLLRRSGRLQPARALAIARQMAEAIEAAHQIGIVHRDIKPSNVMICPASAGDEAAARVVMTDFGLAKFEAGAPNNDLTSISQPGRAMGTLSYMSPEQLKGGEVSCLTDIYAFGLVLYEMVTGVKAFPDSSTMETAYRRTVEPPPSPRTLSPDVPREWETAVLGCLQIEPAGRFQHAMDAVAILEGSAPYSSRLRLLQRPTPVQRRRLRRRVALIAAGCVAGVALSAIGLRYFMARGDSAVAAGALVYLAPVKNETGEKQLDNVTELVRAGLEQSAHINLLDAGRVGDILQQMTKPPDAVIDEMTAREIAMRAGAARVVFATIAKSATTETLDIEMQQPDRTPRRYHNRWHNSFTWQITPASQSTDVVPEQMLSAIRNASDWVRYKAGESEHDIAQLSIPPGDVTTSSWEALTNYANAQKFLARSQKDDAIAQLEEAIKHDNGFARAHAELADNLVSLGRRSEGYQEYVNALDSGNEERLSRKERDFIKGTYANDTRDYTTALAAFRDYSAFYENDFNAWFYQAYPLDMLDRPSDAIHALQRADPLGTVPHMTAGQMVYNYMLQGDEIKADEWTSVLRQNKHENLANTLAGINGFAFKNYGQSWQFFRKNQQSSEYISRYIGYTLGSRLLAEQGRYADAFKNATDGLDNIGYEKEHKSDRGVFLVDRAAIACRMGNYSQALRDMTDSLQWNETPDSILVMSTIIGTSLPSLTPGYRKQVVSLLSKMDNSLPESDSALIYAVARTRVHGELALARNDPKGALVEFRKTEALDAPLFAREYLARALLAMAETTTRSTDARSMREEALHLYARTALRPASVWRTPWYYPPGFVGDQMASYLTLAASLGLDDAEVQTVRRSFKDLRGVRPLPAQPGLRSTTDLQSKPLTVFQSNQ